MFLSKTLKALTLTIALGFVALAAPMTESHAAGNLSQAQLRSLFPGSYVGEIGKSKIKFMASVTAKGRVMARAEGKVDQGVWRVKGGKLCIKWAHWNDAKEQCRFVKKQGAWYAVLKVGGRMKLRFRRR